LSDHPRRHVAAVAPADVREAVWISDPLRDQRVDAGHDVAVIAAAPIVDVRAQELLAVVRAAARVRIEDRPSFAGPHLTAFEPADAIAVHVSAGGSAVSDGEHWILFARLIADRLEQDALHFEAIAALPRDDFRFAQGE